jgi:hypothetical protein
VPSSPCLRPQLRRSSDSTSPPAPTLMPASFAPLFRNLVSVPAHGKRPAHQNPTTQREENVVLPGRGRRNLVDGVRWGQAPPYVHLALPGQNCCLPRCQRGKCPATARNDERSAMPGLLRTLRAGHYGMTTDSPKYVKYFNVIRNISFCTEKQEAQQHMQNKSTCVSSKSGLCQKLNRHTTVYLQEWGTTYCRIAV